MRKVFSYIFLIAAGITLAYDVWFLVKEVIYINEMLAFLDSIPGASGVDYLGIDWFLGIGLFLISVFGLLLSIVDVILAKKGIIKVIACVMAVLFFLLLFGGMLVLLV